MTGAVPISAYVMSLSSMAFCALVILTVVRTMGGIWRLGE